MRKSLQRSQGKAPSSKQRHSRWRTLIVLAACLSLVATSWITAQQSQRQVARKAEPPARPTPVAAPLSFTPNTPAKEYIYAGGKLVATEEPTYFYDVSTADPYYNDIIKIAAREVTLGCGGGNYCTNQNVTREQMAAFIIRALGMHTPPTPAQQRFNDVPPSNQFYAFIEQMALRGITLGCSANPPLYCPTDPVTHEQMAAFMERALHPPGWVPPEDTTQTFCDVPSSNQFYKHIELYAGQRHVWEGCENNNTYPETTGTCANVPECVGQPKCFCRLATVTRRQMARILVRNFGL